METSEEVCVLKVIHPTNSLQYLSEVKTMTSNPIIWQAL